jgi:hypothetical protein
MKSLLFVLVCLLGCSCAIDVLVLQVQLYLDVACNMLNQTQEVPIGVCLSVPALESKQSLRKLNGIDL